MVNSAAAMLPESSAHVLPRVRSMPAFLYWGPAPEIYTHLRSTPTSRRSTRHIVARGVGRQASPSLRGPIYICIRDSGDNDQKKKPSKKTRSPHGDENSLARGRDQFIRRGVTGLLAPLPPPLPARLDSIEMRLV